MSRSGYSDDGDASYLGLWRANVDRSIAGKRGQTFLREMAIALDSMPVKELIADELVCDGAVCAIGAVAIARQLDVSTLDAHDPDAVGKMFGVAPILAQEIVYENDERGPWNRGEMPAERWIRMRAWVAKNTRPSLSEGTGT